MTAEEMFAKIGYKRSEDVNLIVYTKQYGMLYSQIYFTKEWEEIDTNFNAFTLDEFKAIHKQMEELGWLE